MVPLIASANRDERVFDAPDNYDRAQSKPASGIGLWYSLLLGAHPARLEGKIVVEQMAERYSQVALVKPEAATVGDLGGPKELAVIVC